MSSRITKLFLTEHFIKQLDEAIFSLFSVIVDASVKSKEMNFVYMECFVRILQN